MEKVQELQSLIDVFKQYRDLLTPIQSGLRDLVETYSYMENDLKKLSDTLNGDNKTKLDQIYSVLSKQYQKNAELESNIDLFMKSSNKYTNEVDKLYKKFEQIETNIEIVNQLDVKARDQIEKLERIIEEKKINYDIKELQRILDIYNNNVKKVSTFINKDVAQVLNENTRQINSIKKDNETMNEIVKSEHESIKELVRTFSATNTFLKSIVEKEDVNEEYLFEILDKWANTRGIKVKK